MEFLLLWPVWLLVTLTFGARLAFWPRHADGSHPARRARTAVLVGTALSGTLTLAGFLYWLFS